MVIVQRRKLSNCVVLTIKGWDGSRILGVFESIDKAKEVQKQFLKPKAAKENKYVPEEEFIFDILEMNKISRSCQIIASSSDSNDQLVRTHTYSLDQ